MRIVCADEAADLGITHKSHNNHFCAVVKFENKDKHFWNQKDFCTWMPKDIELFALIKMFLGISPAFRALFASEFDIKNLRDSEKSQESPVSLLKEKTTDNCSYSCDSENPEKDNKKLEGEKMEEKFNHEIVFDIETTGLNAWYGDKVTCICAKEIGSDKEFRAVGRDEKEIIEKFFKWLGLGFPVGETRLVSANGREFDVPFLLSRAATHGITNKYLTSFAHFDLLNDITFRRISLNDMAKIYGLETKISDGKQAIRWFNAGNFEDLENYCKHDVLLTEKVYKAYLKNKTGGDKSA